MNDQHSRTATEVTPWSARIVGFVFFIVLLSTGVAVINPDSAFAPGGKLDAIVRQVEATWPKMASDFKVLEQWSSATGSRYVLINAVSIFVLTGATLCFVPLSAVSMFRSKNSNNLSFSQLIGLAVVTLGSVYFVAFDKSMAMADTAISRAIFQSRLVYLWDLILYTFTSMMIITVTVTIFSKTKRLML